jgi:hypothetical protein
MIALLETNAIAQCGECDGGDNVLVIATVARMPNDGRNVVTGAVALCGTCRVRLEGMLRGARKHGPRVPQYSA